MPKRRNQNQTATASAHLLSAAAALGAQLRAKVADRPVDSFALFGAAGISLIIVVNAVFLQTGSHPAPFFANSKPVQATGDIGPRAVVIGPAPSAPPAQAAPAAAAPSRPAAAPAQPVAARRNDPIADLIAPSSRVIAVQRVLSDYGYGQIKPSGFLDEPTSKAIERFEREHKMPVTGRITERLVNTLSALTGRNLN